jgi:hypothetical protein
MKVAIFSESDLDGVAVRILIDSLLGLSTQAVGFPIKARGWPALRDDLPKVILHLHYCTDAEALVIVADGDDSPLHDPAHNKTGQQVRGCRFCELHAAVQQTLPQLVQVANRATLKVAIGIAVPAIEAWFLCGNDPRATEAFWRQGGFPTRGSDMRKGLKRALYGKEPASSSHKSQRAQTEAQRLAQDLSLLETHFPIGFGALAHAIRNW